MAVIFSPPQCVNNQNVHRLHNKYIINVISLSQSLEKMKGNLEYNLTTQRCFEDLIQGVQRSGKSQGNSRLGKKSGKSQGILLKVREKN